MGAGIVCILPGADATTARMVTVEDDVIAGETVAAGGWCGAFG
jgi:hypothetical protein